MRRVLWLIWAFGGVGCSHSAAARPTLSGDAIEHALRGFEATARHNADAARRELGAASRAGAHEPTLIAEWVRGDLCVGDLASSERRLARAREQWPWHLDLLLVQADLFERMQRFEAALHTLELAEVRYPMRGEPVLLRAQLLSRMGDHAAAAWVIDRYIQRVRVPFYATVRARFELALRMLDSNDIVASSHLLARIGRFTSYDAERARDLAQAGLHDATLGKLPRPTASPVRMTLGETSTYGCEGTLF